MKALGGSLTLCSALLLSVSAFVSACDDKKSSPVVSDASAPSVSSVEPVVSAAPSSAPAPSAPPTSVAAQHILIEYKGAKNADKKVTRSKADAKKLADEVDAKAKAPGADFSALVAQYSEDPGAKDRQGSVGKFTREKMTKPFSDAAFALAVDQVSDVVESEFGFHIIKRNQ